MKVLTKIDAIRYSSADLSIGILWLLHLSALIGISLGFFDWFISKTPFNLSILFLLMVLNYPIRGVKKITAVLLYFVLSMFTEWVGVHYDFLFGAYEYGGNLGVKFDGVPYLIGINWVLLSIASASIASRLFRKKYLRVLVGASLMVFLDLFIEVAAPLLDYWHWSAETAPLKNYFTWFILSSVLHYIYQTLKLKGDFRFSLHFYLVQLIFFAYFSIFEI